MKPFFSFHVSLKSTKRSVLVLLKFFNKYHGSVYSIYVVVVGINSSSFSSRLLSKVQYQPGITYIKNKYNYSYNYMYIYIYVYTITAELSLQSSI